MARQVGQIHPGQAPTHRRSPGFAWSAAYRPQDSLVVRGIEEQRIRHERLTGWRLVSSARMLLNPLWHPSLADCRFDDRHVVMGVSEERFAIRPAASVRCMGRPASSVQWSRIGNSNPCSIGLRSRRGAKPYGGVSWRHGTSCTRIGQNRSVISALKNRRIALRGRCQSLADDSKARCDPHDCRGLQDLTLLASDN